MRKSNYVVKVSVYQPDNNNVWQENTYIVQNIPVFKSYNDCSNFCKKMNNECDEIINNILETNYPMSLSRNEYLCSFEISSCKYIKDDNIFEPIKVPVFININAGKTTSVVFKPCMIY